MEEDKQYIEGKKCVKCPEPAQFAGVDVKKAVYCRPCFVNMVRNKFRTALSKRKIFREGEERECVVIFDGGISACFLLHQISDALQQIVYKRLMIRPTFVVLVSSLEETSIAHVLEKVPALQELFPASVPFVTVHLAAGLCKEPVQLENGRCQGVAQIPLLKQLLDSCKTSTAREEVLRLLREKTTSLIAHSLGIHKIMLPDDGNQLGRLALAQLCLGRGGWLSEMTAVLEKRSSGVTFIRPLRDVSSKEVAIVSHLEEYEKSAIRTNEKQNFAAGSIQAATSTFVDNLFAEGFKATVTTVLSTASKLHVATPEIVCPLCELGAAESGHDLCSCCISLLDEVKEPDFFRTYLL